MTFQRDSKTYIPLFNRTTLAFLGYHDEAAFNTVAVTANGGQPKVALKSQLTQWANDIEYPTEQTGLDRYKDFILTNKNKPGGGLIRNYTEPTFNEVLALMSSWPESSFVDVEAPDSPFHFDLQRTRDIVKPYLIKDRKLFSGTLPAESPSDSCGNRANAVIYEMCYGDNPPIGILDECARYYYDQFRLAPNDARIAFAKSFRDKGIGFVPDYFFSGLGGVLDFSSDSRLTKALDESFSFTALHTALSNAIVARVKSGNLADINNELLDRKDIGGHPNFSEWEGVPVLSSPSYLYYCMGGTKAMDVGVSVKQNTTTNEYILILDYTIWDSFGADLNDIQCEEIVTDANLWPPQLEINKKGFIKPLKAFFLLQHYTSIGGNCKPFITKIRTTKTLTFR